MSRPGFVPFPVPPPRLPKGVSPVLAETARAAAGALGSAWAELDRDSLVEEVRIGADGTGTYRIDERIEEAIVAAAQRHDVNVLSEEIGFLDGGHAATLVIDPLDGSANAAAGVPLSCFSAAVFVDGQPVEALSVWLENGWAQWARAGEAVPFAVSGRRELAGSAVDMLRPKLHVGGDSTEAWVRVARASGRVRILSSTCLEAMLVAAGSIDAFCDPGSQTHRLCDLAAAMLLVPAAGGAVIDAFGQPLEFDADLTRRWSGVIAASAELAEAIAAQIRG